MRGQAAESLNEMELCGDKIADESVPHPPSELEPTLGLDLHISERLPACEEVSDDISQVVSRKGEVTGLRRCRKGKTQPLLTIAEVVLPRIDVVPEACVYARFEAVRSALVYQFQAER